MPRFFPPDADPTAIGTVSEPPFVRLPDPAALFGRRAERFAFLAEGHDLGPYLRFLAGMAEAQHRAAGDLPGVAAIPAERLALAREHAMPPLDRAGFRRDSVADLTLARVLDAGGEAAMPEAAAASLARVRAFDPDELDIVIGNVLADAVPAETVAEHVLVAAGLQVHFARLAATLPAVDLVPIGETLCPACGGPPVASMVVGWPGAENTRFCACPLCATSWHFVRIRCTACGATKGIGYEGVEGGPDTVKAETCDSCGSYTKLVYQLRDPAAEPVADDVASLGLDLLMREGRYRRASYNPYVLGY